MAHELKLGDFPQHIGWAKNEYAVVGYIYKIPNTLFAKLVVIVRALLPANILVRISSLAKQVFDLKSFEISTWIVMELSYLFAALLLAKDIKKNWSGFQLKDAHWLAGIFALVILTVGPIFVFTIPDRLYFGYITSNPYHNPTYILLRPLALLVFIEIVNNIFNKWSWKNALIMAILMVCVALAKQSFTLTILPAGGLLILIYYLKQFKRINWFYVIFPIGLVSIIVLISGYIVNYSGDRGDQILIAPFSALLTKVPNIPLIFGFTLLSIAFPLLVSILYWRKMSANLSFRLAWLNFLVSLVYLFFFAEKINLTSLNFIWGSMIGVFLLFYVTIVELGKILLSLNFNKMIITWKEVLVGSVLFVHIACGIVYYIACLRSVSPIVG